MILDDIEITRASFTPAEAIAGVHGLAWKGEDDRHRLEKILEAAVAALRRGVSQDEIVVLVRAARDEAEAERVGDVLLVEAVDLDSVTEWLSARGYTGVADMVKRSVVARGENDLAIGMISPEASLLALGVIDWRQQIARALAH